MPTPIKPNPTAAEVSHAEDKRPSLEMLIRIALREAVEAEPESLINDVLSLIKPDEYVIYLRQAIATRVSAAMSAERRPVTPKITRGVTRQDLVRDRYWPTFLRQRVYLPLGHKFLSDCTAEDLRFVAQQRRTQAFELTVSADHFDTLADLMDKDRAHVLADFDENKARTILEAA